MSPPPTAPSRMSGVTLGIAMKLASVCCFITMGAMVKLSHEIPIGQIMFFRSAFALIPVFALLIWRRQVLRAFVTSRLSAHLVRAMIGTTGMYLMFWSIMTLPLPEATTISYSTPLFVVLISAVFLGEKVQPARWFAVIAGLIGVLTIMWPRLSLLGAGMAEIGPQTAGALAAGSAAMVAAVAMVTVRNLVRTEDSMTIVLYFALFSTLGGLMTVPIFGWIPLDPEQLLILAGAGIAGGLAQVFLTESYRHAALTALAPFDYASLLVSVFVGVVFFAEVPTLQMITGGLIVMVSGIWLILRERREEARARAASRNGV